MPNAMHQPSICGAFRCVRCQRALGASIEGDDGLMRPSVAVCANCLASLAPEELPLVHPDAESRQPLTALLGLVAIVLLPWLLMAIALRACGGAP